MMFNGLLMCTDSDSDFKESIGRSSEADSATSSCASARAQHYHNKLLATLQILKNKEETIRVQAESLSVAEARISALSARAADLKNQIQRKDLELQALRKKIQDYRVDKSDVSITAHIQEIDNQKNIVRTLQNNLDVIEDLYRECFYETAKQEGLIETLRKSYLDVRLMDKEKADQISRLHYVINTQKWSLDKCQDIAADVENLKVDISNFLNSSNNDSGVWEESIAGGLTEDLHDITEQLLRLRELLTGDCTCGLQEENMRLKESSEAMVNQMNGLRQKIEDLEAILETRDTVNRQHQELIKAKENELQVIRQQLAAVESDTREREVACDTLKQHLQRTEVLLGEKSAELARVQAQCRLHEDTISRLTEELEHSKDISREYCALRGSACAAQRRVRTLRAELARAMQHCADLDNAYRAEVESLESALREAQARGEALCEAAARATAGVRAWARWRRDVHREQEELIKRKDSQIRLLERRLQGQNDVDLSRGSEKNTCTKCVSARSLKLNDSKCSERGRSASVTEPTCSKYLTQNEGSFTSGSSKVRQRRECRFDTSASEVGSSSTPVPPERLSRIKKLFCENRWCAGGRDRGTQRPERRDAATGDTGRCRAACAHRDTQPRAAFEGSLEEVMARVDSAVAAHARARRRWRGRASTLDRT